MAVEQSRMADGGVWSVGATVVEACDCTGVQRVRT